jgi:aryl-alcohol dehydrogenase-like predicted oxidoreductase
MERRNLGNSGLSVSAVGLGCNNIGRTLDLEASRRVIHAALDHGISFFDTGDVYGRRGGSETIIGKVLGPRRKDVVIATKFGRPMDTEGKLQGSSRRYILQAVEASLARLKTDWIDLYQSHKSDPDTPIDETLRALDDLIQQGKVRAIGCSHMTASEVGEAVQTAKASGVAGFCCCEDEYSLLGRGIESDLVPTMVAGGLSLLPYYPLAGGMLTGKYKYGVELPEGSRFKTITERNYTGHFFTDANWHRLDKLIEFAKRRGVTLIELAMGWLAAKPVVASIIAGATSPQQVVTNVKAATVALTLDDIAELDTVTA